MRSFCVLMGLALIRGSSCAILNEDFDTQTKVNHDSDPVRDRRGVIEEEKYFVQSNNRASPWIPGPLPPEDPTTKVTSEDSYQTTEGPKDKPTGRGARASNENWIKLPFPNHDSPTGDILTPPQPSGELINSRMPRVNFITQNKGLEASESRNDKESIQRPTRQDDIRTEFIRPGDRNRYDYKPVYSRQAIFYPESTGRPIYDRRFYPLAQDVYRVDPYIHTYEQRFFPVDPAGPISGPRLDRYDDQIDNQIPRKPKRIIYYAHLPDVVRTPPSVDLRYRYSPDPYRPEDIYRNGRYDYRFRERFPYSMLRKEERNYRDLLPAGTTKDKKIEEKVTPTPILPKKEDKPRTGSSMGQVNNMNNRLGNRNVINSHQYHDSSDTYNPIPKISYQERARNDGSYLFDDPLFDDYQRKY